MNSQLVNGADELLVGKHGLQPLDVDLEMEPAMTEDKKEMIDWPIYYIENSDISTVFNTFAGFAEGILNTGVCPMSQVCMRLRI